jgi:hypothetical protein
VQLERVDHLWEAQQGVQKHFFVCLTIFDKGGVDSFYGMRCVQPTERKHFVGVLVSLGFGLGGIGFWG